jgi:hypothetical protein
MPPLPEARGPLSAALLDALRDGAGRIEAPTPLRPDPLSDDDLHLALYCCYELHYRGFDGVDDAWEWAPALIAFRGRLEAVFEQGLHAMLAGADTAPVPVVSALRTIADGDDAPSLSRHIERAATAAEIGEFLVHRSAYHLKEADPHAWAIPRLSGPAKAALVEIEADEYGGGRAERMHARLFAEVLRSVGLDDRYGAYLDHIPGVTLAQTNLMSMLGLHRRHRGALCGHLALLEMTSTIPNRRYANGIRRVGLGDERTTRFFDEHVEADAVHEHIALHDLAGRLARDEPALAGSVVWGARALAALDRRWADHVLGCWRRGRTSLRRPVAAAGSSAGGIGAAGGGEPRELVGPVAEGADAGLAAPA